MQFLPQDNGRETSISISRNASFGKNTTSQSRNMKAHHHNSLTSPTDGKYKIEQEQKLKRVTADEYAERKYSTTTTPLPAGIPLEPSDNYISEPQLSSGLEGLTFSDSERDNHKEMKIDQQRSQYSHESRFRRLDQSHKLFKAASLSIEERARHIIDGIHFNKTKSVKKASSSEPSDLSGSKPPKPDPLAYGKFTADHLAYPKPKHDRSYIESSRRGAPCDSQSIQASQPVQVAPICRKEVYLGPVDLTQRIPNLKVDSENFVGSRPESLVFDCSHDTNQSTSSIHSPLLNATHHPHSNYDSCHSSSSVDDEITSVCNRKTRRTARFHDPIEEAKILAHVLSDERNFLDTAPLISILPGLTHNQVLELRSQFKQLIRTGSNKKGSNISKCIKLRLKDLPELMKACYVCSIGQWESESYWASHWHHNSSNQPQLLIESLLGRTNKEIRLIKNGFRDKKYNDSLTHCLQMELHEDEIKRAVMLALTETRMEEHSIEYVDRELIDADVQEIRNAIIQKRGGESSVVNIVLLRNDTHLREILRVYDLCYGENFAKEMLKKWNNPVGELLTHVLNGVINAPVRDANLLYHALNLPRNNSLWSELLTSRLIRYHWDRPHLERVRSEFRHLYDIELQSVIYESVPGNYGLFLEGLCVRRVEDDVRILK